jgi:hypothetical protein
MTTNDRSDISAMVRRVAAHYNGPRGTWVYDAFDYINAAYFSGQLPTPLIVWTITPYGKCIGQTRVWEIQERAADDPPTITLHPTLLRRGPRYAFDTLLHECMHVHILCNLGGETGETSHNCDEWIAEVNRLAPLIGIPGVQAGRIKVKRVPVEGAEPNERGKRPTAVARVAEGNMPLIALASFPHGVRQHLGLMDYYQGRTLPFASADLE